MKINWLKLFYIFLAVGGVIVLGMNLLGPMEGKLRGIAFILFTLLCVGLLFEVRRSKWKIVAVIAFYLIFGINQFI